MSTDPRARQDPSPEEEADLVRLVDGTLPEGRRAELEARVAASPGLEAAVREQRRARDALLATRSDGAPARLQAAVAERRRRALPLRRRRRVGWIGGLAVAMAAVALAVVFTLPSGTSGGVVIAEAAELQALPSQTGAPGAASRTLLAIERDGVPFPNYATRFGWRAIGSRTDEVDGRPTTTVTYARAGRRVGYSILGGAAVEVPGDFRRAAREGTLLRSTEVGARTVVTWEREGRTCVMSAVGVPRDELYDLAGWRGRGTVPF